MTRNRTGQIRAHVSAPVDRTRKLVVRTQQANEFSSFPTASRSLAHNRHTANTAAKSGHASDAANDDLHNVIHLDDSADKHHDAADSHQAQIAEVDAAPAAVNVPCSVTVEPPAYQAESQPSSQ